MPLTRCSSNGTSGWKWGNSGHCYTGPGAKSKALKQGYAESGGDENKFKSELAKASLSDAEIEQACAAVGIQPKDRYLTAAEDYLAAKAYVSKKERDEMPEEDFGDPSERKYPVKDQAHLNSAFRLLGRAPKSKQSAIRKRLKEIAKRKGLVVPKADQGDN